MGTYYPDILVVEEDGVVCLRGCKLQMPRMQGEISYRHVDWSKEDGLAICNLQKLRSSVNSGPTGRFKPRLSTLRSYEGFDIGISVL